MKPLVILGCGYTGKVVAARAAARGEAVIATTRSPQQLCIPGVSVVAFDALEDRDLSFVCQQARVLYSIPTLPGEAMPRLLAALRSRPSRVVYLSSTGVYGSHVFVNETTPPSPSGSEAEARLAAETMIRSARWSSMVLRPAAIYGPGRGVHVSMAEGRFRLSGEGGNYVSRIHVEDLATHCEAALNSDLTGAWPVADDEPCTSREIAEFCSRLYHIPMPDSVSESALHHTRRANRRVDGRAIRKLLGITLKYPSFREGIPASEISPVLSRHDLLL